MRIKIDVTQEDIDSGLRGSCHDCPVARAILGVLAPLNVVLVGTTYISLEKPGCRWTGRSTKKISKFIQQFDSGILVKPFSFSLNIPEKFLGDQKWSLILKQMSKSIGANRPEPD